MIHTPLYKPKNKEGRDEEARITKYLSQFKGHIPRKIERGQEALRSREQGTRSQSNCPILYVDQLLSYIKTLPDWVIVAIGEPIIAMTRKSHGQEAALVYEKSNVILLICEKCNIIASHYTKERANWDLYAWLWEVLVTKNYAKLIRVKPTIRETGKAAKELT
jgi:hypothetical protein